MTAVIPKKVPKFYKVHVAMKTDFQYKFVCIERNLKSMVDQVNSYFWTQSVKTEEITEDEYRAFYAVELEDEPKKKTRKKSK
jgi:hypothetical protein